MALCVRAISSSGARRRGPQECREPSAEHVHRVPFYCGWLQQVYACSFGRACFLWRTRAVGMLLVQRYLVRTHGVARQCPSVCLHSRPDQASSRRGRALFLVSGTHSAATDMQAPSFAIGLCMALPMTLEAQAGALHTCRDAMYFVCQSATVFGRACVRNKTLLFSGHGLAHALSHPAARSMLQDQGSSCKRAFAVDTQRHIRSPSHDLCAAQPPPVSVLAPTGTSCVQVASEEPSE